MNAETQFLCPEPTAAEHAARYGFGPAESRYDGWTPEKQALFLRAVSEGYSVTHACRIVSMSKQSAYALRRSARGAGFALGWQAALILGREALADEMLERAMNGVVDTVTHPNGEITERHRHDNRLGMAMLTRMDRMADTARAEASHAAARLVAADFDQYLDLVGRDGGPARAGIFLGARACAAAADELAPIRALARADKWLRTHADLAEPLDTADLDPAARAAWTAEQWARAEAAGLVQLAAPDPADARDGNGQLGQPDGDDADEPVWWNEAESCWQTCFPPPDDFYGEEDGVFGEEGYSRSLTAAEEAACNALYRADFATRAISEGHARDRFFGFASEEDEEDDEWDGEAPAPVEVAAAGERLVLDGADPHGAADAKRLDPAALPFAAAPPPAGDR